MRTLLRLPSNGMPRHYILKQIMFPPPSYYFQPGQDGFGNVIEPIVSYQEQEEIRKACFMAGIDPVQQVGLPNIEFSSSSAAPSSSNSLPTRISDHLVASANKLTEAEERVIKRAGRQAKVEENMLKMHAIISGYRKARKKVRKIKATPPPF